MNMRIINACVVGDSIIERAAVEVRAGRIAAVSSGNIAAGAGDYDAKGMTLLPGFIDMHCHGGLGRDLMDINPEHWRALRYFLARNGVTSFLATSTAAPGEMLDKFLAFAASQSRDMMAGGAEVLGVHLEGPYIEPEQAGMHPTKWLRLPQAEEYERWFASGMVRRITASLMLKGGDELLAACNRRGILLSLGHTSCRAEEVQKWAAQGLRHVTHLYNAMSRAEKRGPVRCCGCLEGALADSRVAAEIIGDGNHVPEFLFRIAALCKGRSGITVASDSTPSTGAVKEGETARYGGEGGERLMVRNGMALSLDGKALVGSIMPLGAMLPRILRWLSGNWLTAARYFATNAAELLGVVDRKGRIAAGCDADLVLVDDAGAIAAVWVRGEALPLDTPPAGK